MEKHQSVFVSTYEEGTKKVQEGNYAFLMESTMIDYAVQRDCNLTQISGLLDSKGYGIATPKGSVWKDKLSLAVLELQEKGVIQMLYDKWWKNAADICIKDEKVKEFKPKPLDLNDLGKCKRTCLILRTIMFVYNGPSPTNLLVACFASFFFN